MRYLVITLALLLLVFTVTMRNIRSQYQRDYADAQTHCHAYNLPECNRLLQRLSPVDRKYIERSFRDMSPHRGNK